MVTAGSIKLAVPISTAVAPASMNSMASRPFMMPPRPITGIFTALATCHTILTATGRTAGPERPPVMVERCGRRRSTSIDIPMMVLMSDTESAPSASAALAISAMEVTLGDSFTIRVLGYTERMALVTSAAPLVVVPNAIPPSLTLGHEIFTSIAFTLSSDESLRAVST